MSLDSLQDQVSHSARSIFGRLQVMEASVHFASERQQQQGLLLYQINKYIEQESQDRRTIIAQVEAVDELLRERSDRQSTQAHPCEGIELNAIEYREAVQRLSNQPKAKESGLTQPRTIFTPEVKSL